MTGEPAGRVRARRALETREVFLDTEAYRRMEFDLTHPTAVALFDHVGADRLSLHVTDITLRETLRQMIAMTDALARDVHHARERLKLWKRRIPDGLKGQKVRSQGLDAAALGTEYFAGFRSTLRRRGATEHAAAARDAMPIFRAYFERRPPFDGKDYKEFPDAFVVDALEAWCEVSDTRMYVVTGDQAMLRAAEASARLIAVPNLADLLTIATADHEPDVEAAVGRILDLPGFGAALDEAIDERLGEVGVVYQGDLADGEVEAASRNGSPRGLDWTVISAGDGRYGLVLEFDLDLTAAVDFEDRELAFYDKEDVT